MTRPDCSSKASCAKTAASSVSWIAITPSSTGLWPRFTAWKKPSPDLRCARLKLTDANRGGILGMPGILAATSFPNRTSPVKRGVWVLEQVLGEHVPPAPPNVPALEKQDQGKVANLTLRQRTELHRTDPGLRQLPQDSRSDRLWPGEFRCHRAMARSGRDGEAIDAAGELPGGKRFSSPRN